MPKRTFLVKLIRLIFFSKVAGSKTGFIHSFTDIFQGFAKSLSNLVHDFSEDCFHKPRQLFAANNQIYVNISIGILTFPDPRRAIVFCKE